MKTEKYTKIDGDFADVTLITQMTQEDVLQAIRDYAGDTNGREPVVIWKDHTATVVYQYRIEAEYEEPVKDLVEDDS